MKKFINFPLNPDSLLLHKGLKQNCIKIFLKLGRHRLRVAPRVQLSVHFSRFGGRHCQGTAWARAGFSCNRMGRQPHHKHQAVSPNPVDGRRAHYKHHNRTRATVYRKRSRNPVLEARSRPPSIAYPAFGRKTPIFASWLRYPLGAAQVNERRADRSLFDLTDCVAKPVRSLGVLIFVVVLF